MVDLSGKVALVTAGSRGLGEAIVLQLAELGADVAFTYLKEREAADLLAERVKQMGRRSIAIQADARDFKRADEVAQMVIDEFDALHILVCNAGFARGGALWKQSEQDWDDVLDTCLKGSYNYIHAVSEQFIQQKYGKVVCIGSINGLRGRMGSAGYNAAKAGLTGLVKTVASEMGQYNVNANVVAPGYIETPSQERTPELIRDLVIKECAIKRLGHPEDIAPVVAFLCSDAARHVTGQTIKVDAGQYL